MANKLFGEVLQGKKPESSFIGLSLEELKGLKNSASSIISRANDMEKRQRAEYLRGLLDAEMAKYQDMSPKAEWKVKSTEELEITDVNKAIKQAQWYKHTYGPKAKAKWQAVLSSTSKDDPMYAKAKNFLAQCDERYNKALEDESYWLDIKDGIDPSARVSSTAKIDELKSLVDELESKNLKGQAKGLFEKLKGLLDK